jgi:toxin ParE1/3/4
VANRKPSLRVVVSPDAVDDLKGIYRYSLEHWGVKQAEHYLGDLKGKVRALAANYDTGRTVAISPGLRFIKHQVRSKSDGHVVVYSVDLVAMEVHVHHVFHSKQDWENKL